MLLSSGPSFCTWPLKKSGTSHCIDTFERAVKKGKRPRKSQQNDQL